MNIKVVFLNIGEKNAMNIINNITNTLKDDLSVEIKKAVKFPLLPPAFQSMHSRN